MNNQGDNRGAAWRWALLGLYRLLLGTCVGVPLHCCVPLLVLLLLSSPHQGSNCHSRAFWMAWERRETPSFW